MTRRERPTLAEIVADASRQGLQVLELRGTTERTPATITHDSRQVVPGAIFCCLRGEHLDGHTFAAAAVAAGATVLLVDHPMAIDPEKATQVVVADSRTAMAPLAASFYGNPSEELVVVGVTGTNGKTTTTHLLADIFEAAGWPAGVIGTLSGAHTTPESCELQAQLAELRDEGKRAVAIEVSSHALDQQRVDATHFAAAVFTNLGQDHLDYHGTAERYFAAKARLFEPARTALGVVNRDDAHGRLLLDAASVPMVAYSLEDASDVRVAPDGAELTWRSQPVTLPLGGGFNVMNALAAATTASVLGIGDEVVAAGLSGARPVPGRFEPVDAGQPFAVIVDYAHTPDALAEALRAARSATKGQVLVVFGCGGDRDPTKRPAMGAVAAELADVAVVTSDNPRSEDPAAIIFAVLSGVPASASSRVLTEVDRRAAIALALASAGPGDVVLVAGKGHEATQTIGDETRPFDDREVARELLAGSAGAP